MAAKKKVKKPVRKRKPATKKGKKKTAARARVKARRPVRRPKAMATTATATTTAGHEEYIGFEIRWAEATHATLEELLHNGDPVLSEPVQSSDRGRVAVEYHVDYSQRPHLQWTLAFPGQTLTNVEVLAQRDGGEIQQVGEPVGSVGEVWNAHGRLD